MLALAASLTLGWLQNGLKVPPEVPVLTRFTRPVTRGPVLAEVKMRVRVTSPHTGKVGTVTLPVPSDYSGQTVITFDVHCEPASALRSWYWSARPDGLNDAAKIVLAPTSSDVWVSYSAKVLLPSEGVLRTMRRNFSEWLGPTSLVQSTDPDIVALSQRLNPAGDRDAFVERVVKWVARNKTDQGLTATDAKSALLQGGDSLGRSTLCAAILRAAGIAARTVAYYPTWNEGFDAEEWLTEYQSDEGNWEMIDPYVGLVHPGRNTAVVLAIASKADEDRQTDRLLDLRPHAPAFTTPEITQELTWFSPSAGEPTSSIRIIKTFPGPSGSRLMTSAKRRSLKVIEAAKSGQPSIYDEAIFAKVLTRGPVNLALYLDGLPTFPDR